MPTAEEREQELPVKEAPALRRPLIRGNLRAAFRASLVISAGCAQLPILSAAICSFTWKPPLRGHSAAPESLLGELQPAASTSPVDFCRMFAGPWFDDVTPLFALSVRLLQWSLPGV